ncbi:PAS domain S-box protein [Actinoplanes sp. NBRC 103695]|uniref:PAS domain S-box protein n=1 Tax=Actinoplanes sp. NBRC 103695 TaxID=3032202 RepID=UPI002556CB04|nr:PAS domain S-box protein [Actinoplanes sp. NBRC 103695]
MLTYVVPPSPAMVPVTAVALGLAGAGLWLVVPASVSVSRRRVGQGLGLLVALVGAWVLLEYLTGRSLGVDMLMFPGRMREWSSVDLPGRPSPHTAVALVATGLALMFLDADADRGYRPAKVLAPAGGLVAAVALLGHAYGLSYLSGASTMTSMSYGAALAFIALTVGLWVCRPGRPEAQVFLGSGPGGRAVRQLAPVSVAVILLVGVLLTAAGRNDLWKQKSVVAAASALLVLTMYVVFLRAGAALNQAGRALHDEREFRQAILHSLREGVIVVDAAGTVLEVSPRWCEITGYAVQDVLGCTPPYPWWAPGRQDERMADLAAAVNATSSVEFDMLVRRPDGTDVEVNVTMSLVLNATGRATIVGSYGDLTSRNRVEAARRRAADQLDHFFDLSPDLLCIAGTDGYFKRLNPAWEHILGHTAEELMSRPFREFIHPDDAIRTDAESTDQLEQGKVTISFENRYRCRDGSYRWLNWNAAPTPDEGLVYAVARDTTAQRAAADDRAFLAAIVDGTDDAIIGKTLDGTIISWNHGAERLYGYPAEQAIGRPIQILTPPEQHEEINEILGHIVLSEPVSPYSSVRVREDGTQVHVEVTTSPIHDGAGTVIGAASITRDISDRFRAEERIRQLVQGAPDAMVIVDESGTIVLINDQTERLFGYSSTDLVGQPIELLVPRQLRDQHVRDRLDYVTAPQLRRTGAGRELAGLRRDGSQFPVEISLAPLDTDQGTMVSAAIRDITERRQVEQALARARDEALAAARLKSQFVAMVSHELRTPMNGVVGLTRLLLDTSLQPGQRRYAEAIRTSGRALLTIINDILDFSKIEAGKIELIENDFALDHLLEEVVQVAAEIARDKDLEVLGYYPPELPTTLRGDDGRLRQILLNLLGNAVKFTEHGEVVLRAEPAAPTEDGTPQITFTVLDTGIGIAAQDLPRLFQSFSQVDSSTTNREFGGTGLGLTIARQLVELMGGRLEVESQPGRGSRFWFTLPARLRRNAPLDGITPKGLISGKRLLVVDDNPHSRQLITQHSRAWGMIPTAVPDGHAALDRLRHEPHYDIALIDQHMPGLDGVELISRIAAEPTIAHPPVVLMTAGYHDDDQIATNAGADGMLPKPIGPSQLYNCLLEILNPDIPQAGEPSTIAPAHPADGDSHGPILLVEDNLINQMVAVDTLATLGYQVDIAGNGLEALELAATKPYQAILMDCQMPKMDGYTATAELRHREGTNQHIPIIAMTAGALAEDRQRCYAAGMDDYLAKPIDPDQLQAALDRWSTDTDAPATSGPHVPQE